MAKINDISKSIFLEISRCPRAVILYDIETKKEKSLVTFSSEQEKFQKEYEEERIHMIKEMRKEMVKELDNGEESDLDLLKNISKEPRIADILETSIEKYLLDIYTDIEGRASKLIEKIYGGKIIFSRDTLDQKRFSTDIDDYKFYCYLDIYQEDKDTIRIFEVKSSTTSYLKKRKNIFKKLDNSELHWKVLNEDNKSIIKKHAQTIYSSRFSSYKDYLIYDLAYQRIIIDKVLEKRDNKKKVEYYLILLNNEYIYDGKKENGENIYSDNLFNIIDLTKLTEALIPYVKDDINKTIKYLKELDGSKKPIINKYCGRKKPRECKYLDICFKELKIPEEDSLYIYYNSHNGFKNIKTNDKIEFFELLNTTNKKYSAVPINYLDKPRQQIQRKSHDQNKPHIDKKMINFLLKKIKYPLYHLDFESYNNPLPMFAYEKPYSQSVFQFSLHIEKEPGVCDFDNDHIEFLALDNRNDYREEFIKKLLSNIPDDDGNIMVYYKPFEKTRIKEWANNPLFKEKYGKQLTKLNNRIIDLRYFFFGNSDTFTTLDEKEGKKEFYSKRYPYYNRNQQGSTSIKYVLPCLSNLTYKGMDIANGSEAMGAYSVFDKLDKKKLNDVRKALLKYCKQDTWAMVLILDELRKMVK